MDNVNSLSGFSISDEFVETPYLKNIIDRCIGYLKVGIPVELRGVAGTGKTSLALLIAQKFENPIVLIYGNDEFATGNLMGNFLGLKRNWLYDNYISSVTKEEESYQIQWLDGRLVSACRHGYTLIYDEFTRTKPETNNMLLSALSEGIIEIPNVKRSERYIKVHPDFKIIFTSNREEYAGVYKEQDALKDRILTIEIDNMDIETEIAIVKVKSGLNPEEAEKIVKIIHHIMNNLKCINIVSVRKSIMLAKAVKSMELIVDFKNPEFLAVCKDIITSINLNHIKSVVEKKEIQKEIDRYFDFLSKGGK